MIKVTKKEWSKIHKDYKGSITQAMIDYRNGQIPQSHLGKREVFGGCIEKDGGTALYMEGIHFIIV